MTLNTEISNGKKRFQVCKVKEGREGYLQYWLRGWYGVVIGPYSLEKLIENNYKPVI